MNILNKKLVILGMQRSGFAAAGVAYAMGADVTLADRLPEERWPPEVLQWATERRIPRLAGNLADDFLSGFDAVVISPGVPFPSAAIQKALAQRIPVMGEIEFAFQFATAPIIAVTGSNGKTTVVNLIHRILTEAGRKSVLCGNVGYPFSSAVLEKDVDIFVVEISSFQMESLLNREMKQRIEALFGEPFLPFRPRIAMVLNFSENHLDRHADMDEYFAAKMNIFQNQQAGDVAVLPKGHALLDALAQRLNASTVFFNERALDLNPNHQAARCVAHLCDVSDPVCNQVFAAFQGIEHRMEEVAQTGGVTFINDSKATTVESARWALQQCPSQRVLLICGGKDKGGNFSSLRQEIGEKTRRIYALGDAREKIFEAFHAVVPVSRFDTFEAAVEAAVEEAGEGDVVLLSPMCASFDMFANFEERGRVFKGLIHKLLQGRKVDA